MPGARPDRGDGMTAQFWEALPDDAVRCNLCAHACRIPRNKKGICGMRVNLRGKLVSLVENIITSPHIDPVEKKPLYHFLPGSKVFSFGSAGCNFSCKFCQNYAISCLPSKSGSVTGQRVEPAEVFRLAEQQRASLVAFTYNEPTIFFELMFTVAGLLQSTEKRSVIVTNGFMSEDCLLSLRRRISAANVDLKSFRETFYKEQCGGRLAPVLDTLNTIRLIGWWLEVTTLIIPGLNDSDDEIRDMARFIRDELGPDTPWHLSAFHPAYLMGDREATTQGELEHCWNVARGEGLNFVYLGNMGTPLGSNTLCPHCGTVCIERRKGRVASKMKAGGVCPNCDAPIPGVWE